jgi:hypothetical protein
MPESVHLRVHGHGEVEVDLVTRYLADLAHAYNSILVFESIMNGARRAAREYPFPAYQFFSGAAWPLAPKRGIGYVREWPPTPEEIALLVPRSGQLVLAGVRLASPGWWDFLGKLNPLEVVRQYLNDRHTRRQDHEYRESAEARRLMLENLKLENEVVAGAIKNAKELGASESDLAPLVNVLINRPLAALDKYQDKNVIEKAEIKRLPPKRDDDVDMA